MQTCEDDHRLDDPEFPAARSRAWKKLAHERASARFAFRAQTTALYADMRVESAHRARFPAAHAAVAQPGI